MNKNTNFTSDKKCNTSNAHECDFVEKSQHLYMQNFVVYLPLCTFSSADTHEACTFDPNDNGDDINYEDDLEDNAADSSRDSSKSSYLYSQRCSNDERYSRSGMIANSSDKINEKANILQNPSKNTYFTIASGVENLSIEDFNDKRPSCISCTQICNIDQNKICDVEHMGNKSIFCDNTFKGIVSTNMSAVSIESQAKSSSYEGGCSQDNCTS